MNLSEGSQQLEQWKRVWLFCAGAGSALIITAVNEFPSLSELHVSLGGWFVNPIYSGWIWAWMLIELACGGMGLALLLHARWHTIPARERIQWAFAFFLLGWSVLIAFIVRLHGETPPLLLWIATVIVLILGVSYWFLNRRIDVRETSFP